MELSSLDTYAEMLQSDAAKDVYVLLFNIPINKCQWLINLQNIHFSKSSSSGHKAGQAGQQGRRGCSIDVSVLLWPLTELIFTTRQGSMSH